MYPHIIIIIRAVFKWLSKVITWLRLLRLVIGLKDSRHFFNQWEAKPKPIAPCTRDFSRAWSELHVIARNCDWFIALFPPVVIGRSNCFGFGFSTVIWKPLYCRRNTLCFISGISYTAIAPKARGIQLSTPFLRMLAFPRTTFFCNTSALMVSPSFSIQPLAYYFECTKNCNNTGNSHEK